MDWYLWAAIGVLLITIEMVVGSLYLLAIGVAFVYPLLLSLMGSGEYWQLLATGLGITVHVLLVMIFKRRVPSVSNSNEMQLDIGQRVEVLDWEADGSARVVYRGAVWQADLERAGMPRSKYGHIHALKGSRLVIATSE